jgi:hypothetical protein
MFRRVVVFVEKYTYFVVISELLGFAQNLDEFLHILHRLLVRFPSDFLQMQRDKLGPIRFDV